VVKKRSLNQGYLLRVFYTYKGGIHWYTQQKHGANEKKDRKGKIKRGGWGGEVKGTKKSLACGSKKFLKKSSELISDTTHFSEHQGGRTFDKKGKGFKKG